IAMAVTGVIFLIPFFCMDFSKADQIEIEAMRRRYNSLVIISAEKSCGFEYQRIPELQKPQAQAPEAR
ncbi:MAG: hypothetical protein MUP61_01515, partial [Burkholderiales bacterium]|nr:hypothetical protein [Burkholderiales bacterium]